MYLDKFHIPIYNEYQAQFSGLYSWSTQQYTLNITWFSFDSQQCDIGINSGIPSTNSFYLKSEELWNNGMDFMEEFAKNGEWEVAVIIIYFYKLLIIVLLPFALYYLLY